MKIVLQVLKGEENILLASFRRIELIYVEKILSYREKM